VVVLAGGEDGAGSCQDFEAEVAALFGPLAVLFGQDGADEADDGVAVGEDVDDVGAPAHFPVTPLLGVVRPDLAPHLAGEGGEGEDVAARGLEVVVKPKSRSACGVRELTEGLHRDPHQ